MSLLKRKGEDAYLEQVQRLQRLIEAWGWGGREKKRHIKCPELQLLPIWNCFHVLSRSAVGLYLAVISPAAKGVIPPAASSSSCSLKHQ